MSATVAPAGAEHGRTGTDTLSARWADHVRALHTRADRAHASCVRRARRIAAHGGLDPDMAFAAAHNADAARRRGQPWPGVADDAIDQLRRLDTSRWRAHRAVSRYAERTMRDVIAGRWRPPADHDHRPQEDHTA